MNKQRLLKLFKAYTRFLLDMRRFTDQIEIQAMGFFLRESQYGLVSCVNF